MVKLKNSSVVLKQIVLILTFLCLISCAEKKQVVSKIVAEKISISDTIIENAEIESFIKPYRDNIDKDLSQVLAMAPKTIDKNGEWQSPMGNFLSDITLEKTKPVFYSREKKQIDICLLNHGGIRSTISAGNVTARTAYEIMPFENSAYVVGLKSDQIIEMVNYIIGEKKPHPLSGLTFTIDKNNVPKNIFINGKAIVKDKIYYVVTSDYLINGGDNMLFFKKGIEQFDLDYKLRNIIIDYFKENDTIIPSSTIRITKEIN